jgi:non-heme chloroperoxidase
VELTGRRTAELLSHGRLIVYEAAPHGLYLTHRERLNDDLAAFIQAGSGALFDEATSSTSLA